MVRSQNDFKYSSPIEREAEYNLWLRKGGDHIEWVLFKSYNTMFVFLGKTGERLSFRIHYYVNDKRTYYANDKQFSNFVVPYPNPDDGTMENMDFGSGHEAKKYVKAYFHSWKRNEIFSGDV